VLTHRNGPGKATDDALRRLRGVVAPPPRAASLHVRVLRSAGRVGDALELLRGLGDGRDDDVEMHANRIAVLDLVIASWIKRGLGEFDRARALVDRWLTALPRDPDRRAERG
jgi:hypothetical protein